MHILTMADVPPDPNAGASGTEVKTIAALRAMGHHVDEVWAQQLGRRIAHGNLHYLLELPRNYRRELQSRGEYDVYHVNQPHGFLAAKWLRESDRRGVFVHRSHGLELHVSEVMNEKLEPASAIMATLLARHSRAIAKYADGHIVSSSLDRDFLIDRLNVPRTRIAVIPQAVPDEYTTNAPPMTAARLRKVLYAGQFAPVKGPDLVADAMRRLASTHELTWVCARQHHEQVRALVPQANLLDWMPLEKLRHVYDEHGVFLFPSRFEGFGKAFLEAMSRGMCVIATDVGGAHDLIEHGIDGVLVPPDGEVVADAVKAVDLERGIAMSNRAAAKASQYTWSRVAKSATDFYAHLLELPR